jgi:hypothetical protein
MAVFAAGLEGAGRVDAQALENVRREWQGHIIKIQGRIELLSDVTRMAAFGTEEMID